MNHICVFEDDRVSKFFPLTTFRPVYMLMLGANTLFDKIYHYFHYANITLHCRQEVKPKAQAAYPNLPVNNINTGSACLFINGRVVFDGPLYEIISAADTSRNLLFTYRGHLIAAYLNGPLLDAMVSALSSTPPDSATLISQFRPKCVTKELDGVTLVDGLMDLIEMNSTVLKNDFNMFNQPGIIKGDVKSLVAIYDENNIFIDKNTVVEDFVLLNALNGPIIIEKDVYIESGSRIEGPVFIGRGSRICGGSIKNSSIGPLCKVAGEVTHCIFYGYSNKAHAGFMGHSYIGEWVNLGAGTTNSNLKNTYGPITLEIADQRIETGRQFLGAIIGDHVKTGIGTILNTGTVIGCGASIFGAVLHPKYIPPFSWGVAQNYAISEFSAFITTAERMMARRQQVFGKGEKEMIQLYYDQLSPKKRKPHAKHNDSE